MLPDERRTYIVERVASSGRVTIAELCQAFGISEMTARRDLIELDRAGLLRRVHGGAIRGEGRSYEPAYRQRAASNVEAKQRIGVRAAALVCDGDSLALDVGTTTLALAEALVGKLNLTLITNSLPIANVVASHFSLTQGVRLILAGGVVRAGELSMVGSIAEATYRAFHVDKAFLGIGGLSLEEGLTEYNLEDALVKQAVIASAQQRIVLADGSKLGRTTFASVAPLSAVHTLVTDRSAPEALLRELRQQGLEVIVAE